MPLSRYFKPATRRALLLGKRIEQAFRGREVVDCYFGCANEWRYPAFLYRALQRAGVRTWAVPDEGVDFLWRHASRREFARRTRLSPRGGLPPARLYVLHGAAPAPEGATVLRVSIDYFSPPAPPHLVMPYFIHPDCWRHEGEFASFQQEPRTYRVGFAGTMSDSGYRADFDFPILNRSQILTFIPAHFHARSRIVRSAAEFRALRPAPPPLVLVTVTSGGDSTGKHILQGRDYLRFLGACDFFLAPPGAVMPFAHNLVEAMALGAIPILNYGSYLSPPLQPGVNCLAFDTLEQLAATVEHALALPAAEVARLRRGVAAYVREHLSVDSFAARLRPLLATGGGIVVNDESQSVARWRAARAG